jgi:hypothetical protein
MATLSDAELGARVRLVFHELGNLIREQSMDHSYITQQALVQMRHTINHPLPSSPRTETHSRQRQR